MAYGTDQGLIDYLAETGRTLPVGVNPAFVRADGSAWVDMFERKFKGVAVSYPPSFPRDIYNPVPQAIEYAAYEAAYASATGTDIFGAGGSSSGSVTKRKVDVLEITYAESKSEGINGYFEDNIWIIPRAYRHLLPYLKVGNFFPAGFVVGNGGANCGC